MREAEHSLLERETDWELIKADIRAYADKNFVTDDPARQAQYDEVYGHLTSKVQSRAHWNRGGQEIIYALFEKAKKAKDVGAYLRKLKEDDAKAAAKSEEENREQDRRLAAGKQREKNRAEQYKRTEELYARLAEERKVELELEKRKQTSGGPTGQTATGPTGPLFGMAYSVSAFGHLALPELDFRGSDRFTSFM